MSTKLYPLKVKNVQRETGDCVLLSFDVPQELKQLFRYTQGQYLTLEAEINNQKIRRCYSLCSCPLDENWSVAVKKVSGGIFSTFANEMIKSGDVIHVLPPKGNFFTQLNTAQAKNYMAFAVGSGITPILSIIETTLRTEPQSRFTLLYGNKNRSNIIFKEALEALKDKFMQRFRLHHILSREKTDAPLHHGRIDPAKCNYFFDKLVAIQSIDTFFLCGPEEMIFNVKQLLEEKGVSKEKIHFELFVLEKGKNKKSENRKRANDEPTSKITVKLDGIESSFDLDYNGEDILDAALHEGISLPFACKGGVCCTCKAKLVEGKVIMDTNYGLESDEIAAGFILTCQSHPASATVKVDFDAV